MKNLAADSNLTPQTTLETISRLQELCKIHRKFLKKLLPLKINELNISLILVYGFSNTYSRNFTGQMLDGERSIHLQSEFYEANASWENVQCSTQSMFITYCSHAIYHGSDIRDDHRLSRAIY